MKAVKSVSQDNIIAIQMDTLPNLPKSNSQHTHPSLVAPSNISSNTNESLYNFNETEGNNDKNYKIQENIVAQQSPKPANSQGDNHFDNEYSEYDLDDLDELYDICNDDDTPQSPK